MKALLSHLRFAGLEIWSYVTSGLQVEMASYDWTDEHKDFFFTRDQREKYINHSQQQTNGEKQKQK